MDADFWHQKWQKGDIGFHEGRPNQFLATHFDALRLPPGARVFLPLCGKTRDIAWLLAQGCKVVGAELSEQAIGELFAELELQPVIARQGAFIHYSVPALDVFVGDVFALDTKLLGKVDAIYDRAALVALPPATRERYAAHLHALCGTVPQLLVSYEYDQERMKGPPFSVPEAEIRRLHGGLYRIEELARQQVPGGMKGSIPAEEAAWLLAPH